MRTSEDVYHRLLHDASLGLAADTTIGYLDRFRGAMEKPLLSFNSKFSEIPWHRVLYMRAGSEFLWHKTTRLDTVFNSTDAAAAQTSACVAARAADVAQALENAAQDEEARLRDAHVPRRSHLPRVNSASNCLTRVPVHRCSTISSNWAAFDSVSAWQSDLASEGEDAAPNLFSVGTINVLHDCHLPTALLAVTRARWRAIVDQIATELAAFWVLTEVSPAFCRFILDDERVRALYCTTDGPGNRFETLPRVGDTTGQLVLVRQDLAVRSVFHCASEQASGKRFVFVIAQLPDRGPSVALAALHLTAGPLGHTCSAEAVEKRRVQLEFALQCLTDLSLDAGGSRQCDIQVLAGDFNFHAVDDIASARLLEGFCEAPDSMLSPTFNPDVNDLAALQSASDPHRADRVYARFASTDAPRTDPKGEEQTPSVANRLIVAYHYLVLNEPVAVPTEAVFDDELRALLPSGLFASDHWGIVTHFRSGAEIRRAREGAAWTTSTGLVLLPSERAQGEIDAWMRHRYDVSQGKWPPHLNVLFPFVAPDLLPAFVADFKDSLLLAGGASAAAVGRGRHASLDAVDHFRHKGISTVFLRPAAEHTAALRNLHAVAAQVAERVAGAPPRMKGRPQGWTPHLSVARVRNADEDVAAFVAAARTCFAAEKRDAWALSLSHLAVLQKVGRRMEVVETIPLYAAMPGAPPSAVGTLQLVRALARRAFGGREPLALVPVGSAALMRGHAATQDLDVVLVPPPVEPPLSAEQFVSAARRILVGARPGALRCAGDAICPIVELGGLRQTHGTLPVDVMFGDSKLGRDAVADSKALAALLDSLIARSELTLDHFVRALQEVKAWANAKMLTGRGYTLFSGVSWSIMMLVAIQSAIAEGKEVGGEGGIGKLLVAFFSMFASFDFAAQSVTLDGPIPRSRLGSLDGVPGAKPGCVVVTPTARDNANRRVSSAVVDTVQTEMRAALAIAQRIDSIGGLSEWSTFARVPVTVADILSAHATNVIVVVTGVDETLIGEVEGWLRGRFAQFVNKDLGERGIWVRPSAKLDISRARGDETGYVCGVSCGICESYTTATVTERRRIVAQAGAAVNERFIHWKLRPTRAKLRVVLKRGIRATLHSSAVKADE